MRFGVIVLIHRNTSFRYFYKYLELLSGDRAVCYYDLTSVNFVNNIFFYFFFKLNARIFITVDVTIVGFIKSLGN